MCDSCNSMMQQHDEMVAVLVVGHPMKKKGSGLPETTSFRVLDTCAHNSEVPGEV